MVRLVNEPLPRRRHTLRGGKTDSMAGAADHNRGCLPNQGCNLTKPRLAGLVFPFGAPGPLNAGAFPGSGFPKDLASSSAAPEKVRPSGSVQSPLTGNMAPDGPSEFMLTRSRFPEWKPSTAPRIPPAPGDLRGAPKVKMHDAAAQRLSGTALERARYVRFIKRTSPVSLFAVRRALASTSPQTRSVSATAPLTGADAASRIQTIGARPRPLGRMTLRRALRGGRRPGDLLNGKQDAHRRDPPRGNSGCGRKRTPR